MIRSVNARCRRSTTAWRSLIVLLGITWAAPLVAQAPEGEPLPDTGASVDACFQMQSWLRAFDIPADDHASARIEIDDCTGICATLRWRGRITGTGVSTSAQDAGLDDPPMMVQRAARRAFSASLAHPTVSAVRSDDVDAMLGERLTLEFEAAGPLIPIAGRRWDQVAGRLDPGVDGIALRTGDRLAVRFPSQMLATDLAGRMHRVLLALAHDLGLPARELDELRARHGVSVYRFRTIHLAERFPGATMTLLTRGRHVVPLADVTPNRLHDALDALADHVVSRLHVLDDRAQMLGDYSIIADDYDALPRRDPQQALVAFALVRAARAPGLPINRPEQLRATAATLLTSAGTAIDDPTRAAWLILATADLLEDDPDVAAPLRSILTDAASTLITHANDDAARTRHERSVHAAGLARLLRHGHPGVTAELVRRHLDALWDDADAAQDVELLPWIGWAEADVARATGAPLAHVERLHAVRQGLDAVRIGRHDASDLFGGFALRPDRRGLADAQSLRPLAWLATTLRTNVLTPDDDALVRRELHRQSLRFVLQLLVVDADLWSIASPSRAIGGVRAAPWSSDLPIAAQALGLLVLAESTITEPLELP